MTPRVCTPTPISQVTTLAPSNGGIDVQVGSEIDGLLQRALSRSPSSRQLVQDDAIDILSRCVPRNDPTGHRTILVDGVVQSGKTMSFTAVTALANDNKYRLVMVTTGTTNALSDQSIKRLKRDLGVEKNHRSRWRHFHNPNNDDRVAIEGILEDWEDPTLERGEKKTLLITVLKQHQRLEALVDLISNLNPSLLGPVLIFDDEADHASLNNRVRTRELSTTHSKLITLKNLLPHHTYLQYTATPQANLLISLIDVLSPDGVKVLEPGEGYVGGSDLFYQQSPYCKIVPDRDIGTRSRPLTAAPASLHQAMQDYFIGVAAGQNGQAPTDPDELINRSMMVHPTRLIAGHKQYLGWVRKAQTKWCRALTLPVGHARRVKLVAAFKRSYQDLQHTVPDLAPFDEILSRLPRAIRRTQIKEVNSEAAERQIRWGQEYSWILVGGQKLSRGFTVEGLTVSYMPLPLGGTANADTVQQRGRFFGYRDKYKGYIRVYLEAHMRRAFTSYVQHERHMRERLKWADRHGIPLKELRRRFILDPALRLTRNSVVGCGIY